MDKYRKHLLILLCVFALALTIIKKNHPHKLEMAGIDEQSVANPHKTEQTRQVEPEINETSSGDPSNDALWVAAEIPYSAPDIERFYQLPPGSIKAITYDRDKFLDLEENDIINLPIFETESDYQMLVDSISSSEGIYSITGHIDGYDVGYGASFTVGENWIFGQITTPEGRFNIETQKGISFISNKIKNFNDLEMKNDITE